MVRELGDNGGEGGRRQRWGGCQETTVVREAGDNGGEGGRRQRWGGYQ